jgi:hypothetical protein
MPFSPKYFLLNKLHQMLSSPLSILKNPFCKQTDIHHSSICKS